MAKAKNPVIRIECSIELLHELIEAQRALQRSLAKKPDAVLRRELQALIVKVASAVPLFAAGETSPHAAPP